MARESNHKKKKERTFLEDILYSTLEAFLRKVLN